MTQTAEATGDQLASALDLLGIHFIMGGKSNDISLHKKPEQLISSLAESKEARLRLALIPLFLEHPEFSKYVRTIVENINQQARLIIQCYYTAAYWLAIKNKLQNQLPDYFSSELGLQASFDSEKNLQSLAKRQAELSGRKINWLGTYQHAEQIWKMGREYRKAK